jgi:hypothetical protein
VASYSHRFKLLELVRRLRVPAATLLGGLLLVAGTGGALAASADSPWGAGGPPGQGPLGPQHPLAGMLGVVPSGLADLSGPAASAPGLHRPWASEFASGGAGSANMSYHGGPVMFTNTVYEIFWNGPTAPGDSNYQADISRYFTDLAAAHDTTSNVYAVSTQYTDGSGNHIANESTVGGVALDTDAIPNDPACTSAYARGGVTISGGCATDSDIQTEVAKVIASQKWTPNSNSIFFVFTPPNVGSCFGSYCAYSYYCAYHSSFTIGSQNAIYANMPYADNPTAPGACDVGQYPNGDVADATVNLVSHEQNESITDPFGNAWYDSQGNEIGDKCAWNFGSVLGPNGAEYNQVINSDDYFLQQEWSNASSSCVQQYAPAALPSVTGFGPPSGAPGTAVTISGMNLGGATAVKFGGVAASVSSDSSSQIVATVPAAAVSGPISVTTAAGTATSAASFAVSPVVNGFSPTSGPVETTVTISGGGFSGATAVSFNGKAAGSFSVQSATSITATVPAGATNGQIAVTTPAGTATSSGSFTVTVAPDFALSASPSSRSVSPGTQTTFNVAITPSNGFAGSVQLSVSGLPGRTSASFNPSSATTSSTLTVSTNRRTGRGTYTLTITGTSGSLKHSFQVSLTVT